MRAWHLCLLLLVVGCATPRDRTAAWSPQLDDQELDFAKALAHYGQGLLAEGFRRQASSEALDAFALAAELDPASYRIQSRLAVEALLQGKADQAIDSLAAFCEHNPESVMAWIDLARACQVAGRHDEALQHYRHALALAPDNAFLYAAITGTLFKLGDDRSAVATLKKGIKATGKEKALLALCHNQGREFIIVNKPRRALVCFTFLAAASPEAPNPYDYLLGELYRTLKDDDKASRAYRRATRQDPPMPDAYIRLAIIQNQADPARALRTLEEARERLPENPLILLALAPLYKDAGRMEDLMGTYRSIATLVTETDGRNLQIGFYLTYGAACEQAGYFEQAAEILEAGITAHPDSAQALNYLAYMWAEKGVNLERALAYSQRSLKLEPESAAFLDTLGWIFFRKGQYREARTELLRADALMSDDPTIADHLGDAQQALGQTEKAIAAWTKALMLDPGNASISAKLQAQGVDVEALRSPAAAQTDPPAGTQPRP